MNLDKKEFYQWLESENRVPSERLSVDLKAAWDAGRAAERLRTAGAEAFRNQIVEYVTGLGSSVIARSVVDTILGAAERSKEKK